jgi:p-cumate 2,3-dioxygenase beta subunit
VVSNVRVLDSTESTCEVGASFVVYRSKDNTTHTFIGPYTYPVVEGEDEWKIQTTECKLVMAGLKPHARISIIL